MIDIIEYKDKVFDALQDNDYPTAFTLINNVIREYITSKKDRDELQDLLDTVFQSKISKSSEFSHEILKSMALLALIRGDIPTGKILFEKLKHNIQEHPDPHAELIIQLWENKLNQKEAIFTLQELHKITLLGVKQTLKDTPILIGEDIHMIERLIRTGYSPGRYILSIMEEKTNVYQDVELNYGNLVDVTVFQDEYFGDLENDE